MSTRHVLSDGTALVLRPIEARDKEELQLGLNRLSPESVQRRFLAPKTRFTKAELRYLTEVDGHDHVAIVVELESDPGTVVGVGRYVRLGDEPRTAEAAIVVADSLQRRGVGTVLAEALATEAVGHGIRNFTATTLGENRGAHKLMAHLTGALAAHHDGTGHSELKAGLAA
jgi:RimJ/RimL family protein N-acetyltransferase